MTSVTAPAWVSSSSVSAAATRDLRQQGVPCRGDAGLEFSVGNVELGQPLHLVKLLCDKFVGLSFVMTAFSL